MGSLGTDLVVILNDNEMSITNNVGGFKRLSGQNSLRYQVIQGPRGSFGLSAQNTRGGKPPVAKMAHYFKNTLKNMLPGQLFEELGFTYLGPFDGIT